MGGALYNLFLGWPAQVVGGIVAAVVAGAFMLAPIGGAWWAYRLLDRADRPARRVAAIAGALVAAVYLAGLSVTAAERAGVALLHWSQHVGETDG